MLEHILPKTVPDELPGSVHARYVRCGKPACHCATGALHGPYFRHIWREDGRTRSRYVRQADAAAVTAACERYAYLHTSKRALRRMMQDFSRRSDAIIALLDMLPGWTEQLP